MWIIKQHFYDTLKVRLHEIVLSYGESMTSGSRQCRIPIVNLVSIGRDKSSNEVDLLFSAEEMLFR
jgi:hypothetical protein